MKKIYLLVIAILAVAFAIFLSSCNCNHEYGEWQETKAPTCNSYGAGKRVCTKCGEPYTKMIQPTGAHTYGEWETVKAPSCVELGEEKRTCTVCQKAESKGVPMDINAHSFGDWTVTKEPTDGENGLKERICTLCKKSEQEILFALENQ